MIATDTPATVMVAERCAPELVATDRVTLAFPVPEVLPVIHDGKPEMLQEQEEPAVTASGRLPPEAPMVAVVGETP